MRAMEHWRILHCSMDQLPSLYIHNIHMDRHFLLLCIHPCYMFNGKWRVSNHQLDMAGKMLEVFYFTSFFPLFRLCLFHRGVEGSQVLGILEACQVPRSWHGDASRHLTLVTLVTHSGSNIWCKKVSTPGIKMKPLPSSAFCCRNCKMGEREIHFANGKWIQLDTSGWFQQTRWSERLQESIDSLNSWGFLPWVQF